MRIPRIYTPQALSENTPIDLVESAAHYISNVLRMKAGRELIIFNGEGGEYQAELTVVGKKNASIIVKKFNDSNPESPLSIELGVCLIKSDRMDWLIQKATELGVTKISPLISEFTDFKLSSERIPKKVKHWQQVVENACQQSGRTFLPKMNEPQELPSWLGQVEAESRFVLHPQQSEPIDSEKTVQSLALLVGPEGGLSKQEFKMTQESQFLAISLGPRILRAETAPLAAISILQNRFGDL